MYSTKNSVWIFCPVCGSKTRNRIREDTILKNYPLYCPKCKRETLINAKELHITGRADELVRYITDHWLFLFRIVLISPPYKKTEF